MEVCSSGLLSLLINLVNILPAETKVITAKPVFENSILTQPEVGGPDPLQEKNTLKNWSWPVQYDIYPTSW